MSETPVVSVGVDGTESSLRALAWAAAEALRRGCALRVVTAVPPAPGTVPAADVPDRSRERQRELVSEVLGALPEPPRTLLEVHPGAPVPVLTEASRDSQLLVVGTHGRGPVRSLLLGSVSLSLVNGAHCPVVVMPPGDAR